MSVIDVSSLGRSRALWCPQRSNAMTVVTPQSNLSRWASLIFLAVTLFTLSTGLRLGDTNVSHQASYAALTDGHSPDPSIDPEALEHRGICADECQQAAVGVVTTLPASFASVVAAYDIVRSVSSSETELPGSLVARPLVPPPQTLL